MVGQYDDWRYFVPARPTFYARKINRVLNPTYYLEEVTEDHLAYSIFGSFQTPLLGVQQFFLAHLLLEGQEHLLA
jgi:hypothetical protein